MKKGRYPAWVYKFVGPNQKAKRVPDGYYLYEIKDNREIFVGVITPEGVIPKNHERAEFKPWETYEYGASRVLLELCPEKWKAARGETWKEDLLVIISKVSPHSYLLADGLPEEHGRMHLAKQRLDKFLRDLYSTSVDDLFARLGMVLLLIDRASGEKALTGNTPEVLDFVARFDIQLEELLWA